MSINKKTGNQIISYKCVCCLFITYALCVPIVALNQKRACCRAEAVSRTRAPTPACEAAMFFLCSHYMVVLTKPILLATGVVGFAAMRNITILHDQCMVASQTKQYMRIIQLVCSHRIATLPSWKPICTIRFNTLVRF